MARSAALFGLISLVLAVGCVESDEYKPPLGSRGGDDGEDGADGSTDSSEPTDSGGGETGEPEDTASLLDEPGDLVEETDQDGIVTADLTDASGDSNTTQEFFMVVVNTNTGSSSGLGYDARFEESTSSSSTERRASPRAAPRAEPKLSPFRTRLRDAIRGGRLGRPEAAPPPALGDSDVGSARREFRVRASLTDDTSYSRVDAKLWALGTSVAIWVDRDVPIDWDYDCDGTPEEVDPRDSYGFDNCDLQAVADIVDTNIIPNIRTYFGEESDINADGLVSVVITPGLNYISLTSDDEDDYGKVVRSYADPEVDLNDYDLEENPGSSEQEVIYVFAPDPYGFYNGLGGATIEEYTGMELAAEIARSFQRLVNYNYKVILAEGDTGGEGESEAEETWLVEGLGALAADMTGFGAVYYDDVWDYLDAPHLVSLIDSEETDVISTSQWGAQYLYLRWLYDVYGPDIITTLVQSGSTGSTNLESALAGLADDGVAPTIDDTVVKWQVALLTSGVVNAEGSALVDAENYPPYADPTFITAPITAPSSGDLFGANGYQTGIDVDGINYYMEGGDTELPTENADNRVLTSHQDHLTMTAGVPFNGYVVGDFGAQLVRVVGAPYDASGLTLQATSTGLRVAVIRWNDPDSVDYVKENSFSSTEVDNIELPALPSDGSPIFGIGQIRASGVTRVVSEDDLEGSSKDVYDTDRWLLDLSDRAETENITLVVHLDRQYTDTDGNTGLSDPWLAVVPAELVPVATVESTNSDECADATVEFAYPTTMLEYLYYQLFLSKDPYESSSSGSGEEEDTGEPESGSDFEPCGEVSADPTTCATDWDRDGVIDTLEPMPTNFLNQVHVMQCARAGGDSTAYEPVTTAIIDVDTRDEDEDYYYNRAENLGGRTGESGEEAFLKIVVKGGQEYLVIVGAGTDTGVYELRVEQR